ncbi:MAG: M48 family metallopeptidase, partial [Cyclobacteriaceae bacterium]|nr:M48 family metallopeptidase [Cyclobacteriaceae bacterium]
MNKILIFIALFSIILSSQAQDYETILPQGKIPKDFTTKSSSKYLEEISNLDKTEKKKTRKNKEEFYLVTNYNIDDFLLSGKVIFNDPITLYIDKVLKEILKNDQATYQALRIYTIKSDIPNAFTTNNGMIFVSIGLLAKLETEAQLAFILSHEVIHYKKKHVLDSYLKDSKLESGKEYQKMSSNQKSIIKSSYSKELELAADTEGLELFLESSYQLESIEKVFDLLLAADQVIMDEEFNYSFLEDNDYVLEEDLKLTEFDTVQLNSDYEDAYNTHPNTDKRK